MLLGSLQGCSSSPSDLYEVEDEIEYEEGDKVCYQANGKKLILTLLEDIKPGQKTVFTEKEDGSRFMADVEYIGSCVENEGE